MGTCRGLRRRSRHHPIAEFPLSRLMTRTALDLGAIVNLVEYPAVARDGGSQRSQVIAD